ncbi:hypothetical protein BDF20DRAFT_935163 [Mycotypha africana]|uniref:uncharacterized protein n=1 Tax=Mycotypha africana TaxID=64632 RepID=UPI0023017A48|nr:uncharacterized protein BDF20DRAFT_935163 [Mycotypha africana]KAI8984419.1 hypothetical protein BDF20DRAFT_935163 [Mycotypha africana]
MVDGIVEHRFVQIHQANERAVSQTDSLWSTLSQMPTIAASHCCEKIYSNVINSNNNGKGLLQTVQNLQNLVLTCEDDSKNVLFLQTITRLLIFNHYLPEETQLQFHYAKKDSYQIHPFTYIMHQKPSLYFELLDQLLDIFGKENENAMTILSGFVESVFLTKHTSDGGALLTRLMQISMTLGIKNDSIIAAIYKKMMDILFDFPLEISSTMYLMLVDFLMWISIDNSPCIQIDIYQSQVCGYNYLLPFIDHLLTIAYKNQPVTSYLSRLSKMMNVTLSQVVIDVLWTTLSYILLRGQTLEEQQLAMALMRSIVSKSKNMTLLRIAYLPLYQLVSELNDKDLPKELVALKEDSLELLAYLDSNQVDRYDEESLLEELQKLVENRRMYGLLAHFLVYLNNLYAQNVPVLRETYKDGPEVTLVLNLLFSSPFIYDEDEDVQLVTYLRITELSCLTKISYKFPMLLFLLHRLRSSLDNVRLVAHIFRDILPTLADTNDPFVTSKVLQVVISSINSKPNSAIASLGVKALAHMHQLQPRVWQELKRVFAEWVLRRKHSNVHRKIDMTIQGSVKMELAILTTMRDICKDRPRECAADVLPMVVSLLQACQDLSMASLSILVATINHCVRAGLVEPRSIWDIAVVYLAQFALEQGTQKSALLLKEICAFFAIAGAHHDISELYLQFKEGLLVNFITPLISSTDKNAAQLAMHALANFDAQDIAIILPEKAADYVKETVPDDDNPIEGQDRVLSTLITHEIEHMRRGLFKEENVSHKQQQQLQQKADIDEKLVTNDAGQVIGEREFELQSLLTQMWDTTKVAPGLRSGYAIAMLHTSEFSPSKDPKDTLEALSKMKWYRFLNTAFTDVSLTDHLLLRISSVSSWVAFFNNALADVKNDIEITVSLLLKDLLSRLERSTVPGVTCNIILSIAGLIQMVRVYSLSFAASCASNVIEVLMKNYVVLSGSPLSHSAHLMSEEVQFAARMAVGFLAVSIIGNDKLMRSVNSLLISSAVAAEHKHRNIDTAVDLVQFANGFAAGHFIGALAAYPTKTALTNDLWKNGVTKLLDYCASTNVSDSRVMGILMGLASTLKSEFMDQELAFASQNLAKYLSGGSVAKGALFGSTWLCAVGAMQGESIDFELSGLLESVLAATSSELSMNQHFYHFVVPYTQVQFYSYLTTDKDDQENEVLYSQAFEPLLQSIETDDASSHYRIAGLFGAASLLGVEHLDLYSGSIGLKAERYHSNSRRAALDKLAAIAGLTAKASNVGNLKSGRIAAAVVGKIVETTKLMTQALGSMNQQGISSGEASSLISSSSEPSNYNRLSSSTSYLRGVFDQLNTLILSSNSNENNIQMLLNALISSKGPLPAVNWYNLLISLMKTSPDIQRLCFAFAANHAATSFSLSEFLFTQMISIMKSVAISGKKCEFLFEGPSFATLLELGKLPSKTITKEEIQRRGLSSIVKKITLSKSRVLELVEIVIQKFQYMSQSIQDKMLSTLADHLPESNSQIENDDDAELVSSIREHMFNFVMIPFFNDPETPRFLVQKAAHCSLSDISQVLPLDNLKDFPINQLSIRITATAELFSIAKSQKASFIKHINMAIGCLLRCSKVEISAWDTVAQIVYTESQSDKDILMWLTRILDAFIVFVSDAKTEEGSCSDTFVCDGLIRGLRSILTKLRSCPCETTIDDIQFVDTVYLLDYYVHIGHKHESEQDQVVKRILKITDMTRKMPNQQLTVEFFDKLALGLPQKYQV